MSNHKEVQVNDVEASQKRGREFEAAARPLIKYLADNHHPHVSAIINSTGGQLLEGLNGVSVMDYIKD